MMSPPQASWLPDGRRLHLHHGPIDLIIEAFGAPEEVRAAYAQAVARFQTVLTELVAELQELRRPAACGRLRPFAGPTARRMEAAVAPLAQTFITPMAAVAGSVADEVMAALTAGRRLDKAYVNNGGDIALHLASGQTLSLAIAGTGHDFADRITVSAGDPVRGIATSGWRGRSFSLGIADAVTVLARTGAQADTAATIIANAVDLPGHPAIARRPAVELAPDNDLGDRPVTVDVGALAPAEIEQALRRGLAAAEALRACGLIEAAALFLAGETKLCGRPFEGETVAYDTRREVRSRHTPTPNPSPQGGGGPAFASAKRQSSKVLCRIAAAESPSPLWGGVRGGGNFTGGRSAIEEEGQPAKASGHYGEPPQDRSARA